jgi:glycosyltransferase involved in cell wall biosynthesis
VFESRILHKPLVETNHTPILEFFQYSPIRADWFRRFTAHYDAWMYDRADFVSSPTRLIFEGMTGVDPAIPHRSVSNPIDTEAFRPAPPREDHPFTVLYAGRIAEEKRIDVVMRAVAKAHKDIPDIRMIIVGRGAYETALGSLAKELGMENAITFTGFVPNEDLPKYYAQSDVFAIMSTAETQSIVAMQAFACGIPVIAADAWGFKEYIIPEAGFAVAPGDVDAVAEKMVYLHERPLVRTAMGKKGREYVEQFSIAAVATTWEHIYQDVIRRYNKRT